MDGPVAPRSVNQNIPWGYNSAATYYSSRESIIFCLIQHSRAQVFNPGKKSFMGRNLFCKELDFFISVCLAFISEQLKKFNFIWYTKVGFLIWITIWFLVEFLFIFFRNYKILSVLNNYMYLATEVNTKSYQKQNLVNSVN